MNKVAYELWHLAYGLGMRKQTSVNISTAFRLKDMVHYGPLDIEVLKLKYQNIPMVMEAVFKSVKLEKLQDHYSRRRPINVRHQRLMDASHAYCTDCHVGEIYALCKSELANDDACERRRSA